MLGENKNLRDSKTQLGLSLKDNQFSLSYRKTDKLIAALYMVTDILDKEEPIRNKLRTLGAEIISDTTTFSSLSYIGLNSIGHTELSSLINKKINQILSFLEIGSVVGMISQMNFNILKKEFLELRNAVQETKVNNALIDLFKEDEGSLKNVPNNQYHSIGQGPIRQTTRIGVQKGSTLLKALSDTIVSDRNASLNKYHLNNSHSVFSDIKDKRRKEIISIIKDKTKNVEDFNGATITDIKNVSTGVLIDCGEKTLQRELVSMVTEGILRKTGEKRWSRYSLN